jgi:hypothetical protein
MVPFLSYLDLFIHGTGLFGFCSLEFSPERLRRVKMRPFTRQVRQEDMLYQRQSGSTMNRADADGCLFLEDRCCGCCGFRVNIVRLVED